MKIQEVFDWFVTALETNNMELLDSVLDENIEIFSSALGKMKGIKQAKEGLAWKDRKMDLAKIRIFNQVVRQKGNFASQSVFLVILIGKEIHSSKY